MKASFYHCVPGQSYWLYRILVISLLGCSSGRVPPKGMPRLYSCVVTITQEGEPLAGAIVKLHPQGVPLNWTVSGKTDEMGKAIIHTDGYFSGAPAGEYKVTVDKRETVAPPMPAVLPTDEAALERLYNRQEAETKDYRLVDPLYCNVDSTTLSVSVGKKKVEETFDLGKKYREVVR
jgi:hypothetical protein